MKCRANYLLKQMLLWTLVGAGYINTCVVNLIYNSLVYSTAVANVISPLSISDATYLLWHNSKIQLWASFQHGANSFAIQASGQFSQASQANSSLSTTIHQHYMSKECRRLLVISKSSKNIQQFTKNYHSIKANSQITHVGNMCSIELGCISVGANQSEQVTDQIFSRRVEYVCPQWSEVCVSHHLGAVISVTDLLLTFHNRVMRTSLLHNLAHWKT